jgi:YcxB-like protein
MEVSYQLTEADYRHGLAAWRTSSTWRRWIYRFGIAVLVALVAGSAGLMMWNPKLGQLWLPVFGIGLLCLLLIWVGPKLQARVQFRRMPSAQIPMTVIATDSGMQIRSSHYDSQVSWSTYIGWAEDVSVFVLFPQPRIYVPIPKRAFTSEQLDEFRELLRRNILPPKR